MVRVMTRVSVRIRVRYGSSGRAGVTVNDLRT